MSRNFSHVLKLKTFLLLFSGSSFSPCVCVCARVAFICYLTLVNSSLLPLADCLYSFSLSPSPIILSHSLYLLTCAFVLLRLSKFVIFPLSQLFSQGQFVTTYVCVCVCTHVACVCVLSELHMLAAFVLPSSSECHVAQF